MMKKLLILLLFPLLVVSQTEKKSISNENIFTVFYNVENLFDTINSTNTNDSEFLPDSEKKWNTYRYNYKLNQLAKVFSSIIRDENNDKMLDIIGLCEVENKLVIEDLLKKQINANRLIIFATHNRFFAKKSDCMLEIVNGNIKTVNARV